MSKPLARRGDPVSGYYCTETRIEAVGVTIATKTCGPDPAAVQAIGDRTLVRLLPVAVVGGMLALAHSTRQEPDVMREARAVHDAQREQARAGRHHARAEAMLDAEL